ncbi:SART-1 protein [Halteromyces radiatus]|uniref:SART-1 protein n=1 Tax=Halteromyces radiatus TaxID=101107 RepID=UPI00221F7A08|nr:SART-1 protein [Halteromyces radiatus]KAI8098742.1 SART-1 protein [Halteromyces radiatus]
MSDSLEEINAHRAKLGLPAISAEVEENSEGEQIEEPIDKDQEAYDNYQRVKEEKEKATKRQEILDRIEKSKNRRKQHEKLKGKGLADDDDDVDALAWIRKSRQREKELAEQRAKALQDMDEEQQRQQQPKYKASDLRGLKVAHDISAFEEGMETILTLKDRGILDEDGAEAGSDDELTNVNLEDRERLEKNLENKKKKPGYNPYDDDEFLLGEGERPSILSQYDEEKKKEGFVLGKHGSVTSASVAATRAKHQASQPQLSVAEKLKAQSLDYDKTQNIKDYYTQDEINLTFKKPKKLKKKKKIRQRPSTMDDEQQETSKQSVEDGNQQEEEEEEKERIPYQPPLDANFVDDDDLQQALARARREANRQKKKQLKRMTPEDIARSIAEERQSQVTPGEEDNNDDDQEQGGLVLSETTEFLNSVGNVPIYAREQRQTRTPDVEQENEVTKKTTVTDMDEEPYESTSPPPQADTNTDKPIEDKDLEQVIDEPLVGHGLAATLSLLTQKGLMKKATPAQIERDRIVADQIKWQAESRKREQQLNRQIQQRNSGSGERDRHRDYDVERQKEREERDRLREQQLRMENYKPDVFLEYVDDQGHVLNTKEAFRYQSHKFHGKTSGKGKTEKRMQKLEEERKLNMMSSTDTPLNLAGALLERQQKTGNAHVVLSVGNRGVVPSEAAKELGIKRSLEQKKDSPNKKR